MVTSQYPRSTRMILGAGLALSEGEVHRRRRRAVLKAFDMTSLEAYLPQIENHVREFFKNLCEHGAPVRLQDEIKKLMFRISAEQLLGVTELGKEAEDWTRLYTKISNNLFSLPINIPGLGLHTVSATCGTILSYFIVN